MAELVKTKKGFIPKPTVRTTAYSALHCMKNEIYVGPVIAAFCEALGLPCQIRYNQTVHPADEPKSQYVAEEKHAEVIGLWEGPVGRAFSQTAFLYGYESEQAEQVARAELAKISVTT